MGLAEERLKEPFRDVELLLRPLVAKDAGEMFMLIDSNRRELSRWMPWVKATSAVADASFYILSLNGIWGTGMTYGIFEHSRLAGTIGFQHASKRDFSVQIGYWLGKEFQGRGLARRALRILLEAVFIYAKVHRVSAKVALDNVRSARLLEKSGFTLEGVEREGIRVGDVWKDHRIYSLLASEFIK